MFKKDKFNVYYNMKYIIVGGGPTGLSLAYGLVKNNYQVVLLERDSILGGSWNSRWVDGNFSENSPRVLSTNGSHMDLLYEIGLTNEDFDIVYGNIYETNYKVFNFVRKYFEFMDYVIFLSAMIKYRYTNKYIKKNNSLQDWFNDSKLSDSAKKGIRILSIIICDTPQNTNATDFFASIESVKLVQMKDSNKWHNLLESYFDSLANMTIIKNTTVLNINDDATAIQCKNRDGTILNLEGDRIVLCTQSDGIYPILQNSSFTIKNNWNSEKWIKEWSTNTYYSCFGFQLHFNEIEQFPDTWCWSCQSDWCIIILPVSNWLSLNSVDDTIKTVWSCCIVDMETKSKRLNKTPNECTKEEITDECIYQLKQLHHFSQSFKTTISPGIYKKNGKWISSKTGFTRKKLGYLPISGNLPNLFALGCFTKVNYSTSYMKTAVDASAFFLKNKHGIELLTKKTNSEKKKILLTIIVIISIILIICIK